MRTIKEIHNFTTEALRKELKLREEAESVTDLLNSISMERDYIETVQDYVEDGKTYLNITFNKVVKIRR